MHMAAAVASNPNRSSVTARPHGHVVTLRRSSSLARVSVDPAEVLEGAADNKQAAAAAREQQRHRSRDEENPRPARRRQRDEYRARGASPDRKRRRENVSHYRDAKRSSSSRRLSSATRTSAYAHRRDRDDAYRAGKKRHERRERDRAREDVTRKSVSSGASRTEQRARANRSSAAAVTKPHGATVDDDRKPTPEKVETPQNDEAEIRRRQEIQRQREEARREINKMVKTVEFNDPFISFRLHDVLNPRAH